MNIDYGKLTELLRGIGKGTFVANYEVIAKNYNGNRNVIKKQIAEYGIKTTGKPYTENVITSKTSKSCVIFKKGWNKEALKLCGVDDIPLNVSEKKTREAKNTVKDKHKKRQKNRQPDKSKYSSNKSVISNIKKLYAKIGREVEKMISKYGENTEEYSILQIKAENERLKKELEAEKNKNKSENSKYK